jgi:hypothetical protein
MNSTLIDVIKDYQETADKAVNIIKDAFQVTNIIYGWRNGLYEQTGELKERGLKFYAFHGIGLAAHFADRIVDFDFAYLPEPRHDGFDLWRLKGFIENQSSKYGKYLDEGKLEREFKGLVEQGVIIKPNQKFSTDLYFFKESLTVSQL